MSRFGRWLILCIPILLFRVIQAASGEIGAPFITNYSNEEYGASQQNWEIVQDHRGLIYVGNNSCVLEYDGVSWRQIQGGNVAQEVNRSLAVAKDGTVYVGGINHIGYLASNSTGNMEFVSLKDKLPIKDRDFNDVWQIFTLDDGVYFVTTNKIFYYHRDQMRVIDFAGTYVKSSMTEMFFLCCPGQGLMAVRAGRIFPLPQCESFSVKKHGKIFVVPYDSGKILIVTSIGACFLYDLAAKSPSLLTPFPCEIGDYIRINLLSDCEKITANQFAFATRNGGIIIMGRDGRLQQVINVNRGLANNHLNAIARDQFNNLWAALNEGIAHIELSSPVSQFSKNNGIKGEILAVTRFQGQLYVGSFDGVYRLAKYHLQNDDDRITFLPLRNIREQSFAFLTVNNFLLSAGTGVFQIQGDQGIRILDLPYVMCLGQTPKFPGYVFLGRYPGFSCYHLVPQDYQRPKDDAAPPGKQAQFRLEEVKFDQFAFMAQDQIGSIEVDPRGDLWLNAMMGDKQVIYVRFGSGDLLDVRIIRCGQGQGLPETKIHYAKPLGNKMVVTTDKGIFDAVFSDNRDQPVHFVRNNDFGKFFRDAASHIMEIGLSSRVGLFLNSFQGFGQWVEQSDHSSRFLSQPFKVVPGVYRFLIEEDGAIWLYNDKYLFRYDTNVKKDYQIPYHALIRKVQAAGREIFGGTYFSPSSARGKYYSLSALEQPEILKPVLPYHNNSLNFEFAAAFYEQPRVRSFRYFLKGFDPHWSEWNEKTAKEYTNLPEGGYSFMVQAKNIFEVESQVAAFSLIIKPPWWRTWWAYSCFSVMFVLLLFSVFRLNTRRLIASKQKLEQIVIERTQEINRQKEEIASQRDQLGEINQELNDFAYIVSHDLKAPLRGISQLAAFLSQDERERLSEEGNANLDLLLGRTERLKDLIDGILKYSRATRQNEVSTEIPLAEYVPELINSLVPPDNIDIVIEPNLPTIICDKVRISQVFQNLVSNAIKYMDKPQGKVIIGCRDDDPFWKFYVKDNGPGIADEYKEKIFQIFQTLYTKGERESTGVGLTVVKKIIERYGGRIWIESIVGQGSTFFFTLPKGTAKPI